MIDPGCRFAHPYREINLTKERFQIIVRDHSTFSVEERLPLWPDLLTVKILTTLWCMTIPTKTLDIAVPRQRFLDWLFRVPQTITVEVSAKDVPLDQPTVPGESVRLYHFNPKEPLQ